MRILDAFISCQKTKENQSIYIIIDTIRKINTQDSPFFPLRVCLIRRMASEKVAKNRITKLIWNMLENNLKERNEMTRDGQNERILPWHSKLLLYSPSKLGLKERIAKFLFFFLIKLI